MAFFTAESKAGRLARLRVRWRARPPQHSRALWVLLIVLDVLPWPWGEEILAGIFTIGGLVHPKRRRAALAWAAAHRAEHPWRLAANVCGFLGHWVARTRTIGFRRPDDLRQNFIVEGAEHLDAAAGAAILLGFHLGPADGDLTFRVLGYPVTFLGMTDRNATMGWWSDAWRPFVEPGPLSFVAWKQDRWPGVLYAARRTLLDGGKIYVLADGRGREAFRLRLSVGEWGIRVGWLTLHQLTGAPVLPVIRRLEGRRQIVTIHPPLPPLAADSRGGIEVWRDCLTRLVDDYVRRFPEQCPHIALERGWRRFDHASGSLGCKNTDGGAS